MGLDVGINTLSVFRIARHEAIFIKSEDLLALNDTMLTLMITSNTIIIEKNTRAPLLTILENLAKKIETDKKWKACATCRFLVVEEADFQKACAFIRGEKVNQKQQSRGSLLTKICNKVEIAQKRVKNADATHAFVTKFLQDKTQPYDDFKSQTVENILREEIARDYGEEKKEKEREERKMTDQLKTIEEPNVLEHSESIRSVQRSAVHMGDKKETPDFMKQFTKDSKKLI